MKTLQILSLFTLALFLVSTASALIVANAQFSDGKQTLELKDGENATFDVYLVTYDFPMDVSVKLYNSNNQLVHTFFDDSAEDYFFEHDYDITESVYENLGKYEIRISGSDNAGDSDGIILYLNVVAEDSDGTDTTFPEVTILSPQNRNYNSQIEELHYRIYDENIDFCEYSTDDGATKYDLDCKNGQDAFIYLKSKSGRNSWTVYATDEAGNTMSKRVNFGVMPSSTDTTAPIITVISPEEGKEYSTSRLNLRVLTNEDAEVWFKLDDGDKVSMNNPEDHIYTNTIKVTDGEHEITFYAEDEAGNEASKSVEFSVDINTDNDNKNKDSVNNRYYEDDFDREAYLKQFEAKTIVIDDETSKEQGSNAWIIWLIVGLIILVVLIIVISMLRA